MDRLKGKVALITGGGSGIGLASAKAFVDEGATVVITGRDDGQLRDAAANIGRNVWPIRADVGNLADLDKLYAEVAERVGHLDVLFANAGIMQLATLQQVTEEQFDREFRVNVKGVYFTIQKALPLLRDHGSIILTSSIANFSGTTGFNVYSATKAAVRSFARSWTNDLKSRGIRVNSLSPGPTQTPLGGKMGIPPEVMETFHEKIIAGIPLGRIGRPEETAQAAVFLASDESSFITGIDLCVDGGRGQV